MTGRLPLRPKVLGRFHETAAKILLPIAVHSDAGRERVCGIDQPLGQAQSVSGQVFGHRRQTGRNAGPDLLAAVAIVAPAEHKSLARLFRLLHHHSGGNTFLQLLLARPQLFQLRIEKPVALGRVVSQEVFAELAMPLGLGLCFLLFLAQLLGLGLVLIFRRFGLWLFWFQHRNLFRRITGNFRQQRAGGQANRKVIDLGPGQRAIVETQIVELAFVRGADILVADREGSRGLKTAGQMIAKYF